MMSFMIGFGLGIMAHFLFNSLLLPAIKARLAPATPVSK